MNTDFLDAHSRNLEDAEKLLENARLANADHLYGMAAECGLKCLMVSFGMPVTGDGTPVSENDRKHVNFIWPRYESYRSGRLAGDYALPVSNPFRDWHVSQRYAHRSNFNSTIVEAHRRGAELVHTLVTKAQRERLL